MAVFSILLSAFIKASLLWMSSTIEFWRAEVNMPRMWASKCRKIIVQYSYIWEIHFLGLPHALLSLSWISKDLLRKTKSLSFKSWYFPRDDLMRAIKKLKVMGNGFGMIPVSGSYLVQSVPAELNMDHTAVLQLAEVRTSSISPYFVYPWVNCKSSSFIKFHFHRCIYQSSHVLVCF